MIIICRPKDMKYSRLYAIQWLGNNPNDFEYLVPNHAGFFEGKLRVNLFLSRPTEATIASIVEIGQYVVISPYDIKILEPVQFMNEYDVVATVQPIMERAR